MVRLNRLTTSLFFHIYNTRKHMSKSRTLAYFTWAISNVLNMTKEYTIKGIDWVSNKKRYDVEITIEGVLMGDKKSLSAPQIIAMLDTMSNFGSLEIHITNQGANNGKRDIHSETNEGSSQGHTTDKTIHTDSEEFSV